MGSAIMRRSRSNKIGSGQESSTREVKEYLHVAGTPAHGGAKVARRFAGDGCLAGSHPGHGSHTGIGVGSLAGGGRLRVRSCS